MLTSWNFAKERKDKRKEKVTNGTNRVVVTSAWNNLK